MKKKDEFVDVFDFFFIHFISVVVIFYGLVCDMILRQIIHIQQYHYYFFIFKTKAKLYFVCFCYCFIFHNFCFTFSLYVYLIRYYAFFMGSDPTLSENILRCYLVSSFHGVSIKYIYFCPFLWFQ